MNEVSFESAISAMVGDTEQMPTMIERMLEDVIKRDIKVNIQFTERYTEVLDYVKSLGWKSKYLEWAYKLDNGVRLEILSTISGYTLTVSMQKEPVVEYPEIKTFISPGVLTWSKYGNRKFVFCKHCNNVIRYENADLTYKGINKRGTYTYWCRCPECNRKFTIHQWEYNYNV